jgi:predicted DNA-binding transcriptional regulator YafY
VPAPYHTSRPPMERMLRIHDELRRGAFTNCTKLAAALEVSRKTIVRDIAFMRDRLDLPVEFDPLINAYRTRSPPSPPSTSLRANSSPSS